MKIIDYIEDDCPTWALSYLVNGDASGLEDGEAEQVDEWVKENTERLQAKYPGASIELLFDDGEGDEFNPSPAFGLACATVQCAFAVWVDNDDEREAIRLPWEPEPIEPDEDGAIEGAIRECLDCYPEGTCFDCVAHELWRDVDGGYSVNDSWHIARDVSLSEAIEAIAGRWEVWKLNYCPDARAADLTDTNWSGPEFPALLEACGVPFMEIRPVSE